MVNKGYCANQHSSTRMTVSIMRILWKLVGNMIGVRRFVTQKPMPYRCSSPKNIYKRQKIGLNGIHFHHNQAQVGLETLNKWISTKK